MQAVQRGDSIIQVTGANGTGKTALVAAFASQIHVNFSRFYSSGSFELLDALDAIAADFANETGSNILVVEEAEKLDFNHLMEAIQRLQSRITPLTTIVVSAKDLPLPGTTITLAGFNRGEFATFVQLFDAALTHSSIDELYEHTKGFLALPKCCAIPGLTEFSRAVLKTTRPFERPGLVDVSGNPLTPESAAAKKIIVDVTNINDEFLRRAADHLNFVFEISPRQFEEMVVDPLSRHLQGRTHAENTRWRQGHLRRKARCRGNFLYIVECNSCAPDNPVEVEVVRSLHSVADLERVSGSMIATTSYFSPDARALQSRIKYQMSLKEYLDLCQWLVSLRPS